MFKKLILVGLSVGVNSLVVAGTMGPHSASNTVTVPCGHYWDLGVQALYLKSVFTAEKAYQPSFQSPNSFLEINNHWDWGFRLEGAYKFCYGSDLTMNWLHYKDSANLDGGLGIPPISELVLSNRAVSDNVVLQNRFDEVNLVMGQFLDVSGCSKMRLYGGFQFAHIQVNGTHFFGEVPLVPPLTSLSLFDNPDFKGAGPTFGIQYWYNLTDQFSISARSTGAILIGNSRFLSGFVGGPIELVLFSEASATHVSSNIKAIVPSLEGSLSFNYICNMPCGRLNVEFGYEALNYFNALQTQGTAGILGSIKNSDFGLYGPYIGLTYTGVA